MGSKPLAANEQRIPPFFSNKKYGCAVPGRIDREQHPVFSKQPKFTRCDGVGPQRLHVASFRQWILSQHLDSGRQDCTRIFTQ